MDAGASGSHTARHVGRGGGGAAGTRHRQVGLVVAGGGTAVQVGGERGEAGSREPVCDVEDVRDEPPPFLKDDDAGSRRAAVREVRPDAVELDHLAHKCVCAFTRRAHSSARLNARSFICSDPSTRYETVDRYRTLYALHGSDLVRNASSPPLQSFARERLPERTMR